MKKFINNPDTLTDELLEGRLANHDIVEVRDHMVISRALAGADRVTIVTYGGSGHEPAQHGFVGEGMTDITSWATSCLSEPAARVRGRQARRQGSRCPAAHAEPRVTC